MRVALSAVKPGMVLAGEVRSSAGELAAPDGAVLTPELIARLGQIGVGEVAIQDAAASAPVPSGLGTAAFAALETRFAGVQDEVLLGLRDLLRKRLARS